MKSNTGPWKPYVKQGRNSEKWYPMVIKGNIFKKSLYVNLKWDGSRYETWWHIDYGMSFKERDEAEKHAVKAAKQFNRGSMKDPKPVPVRGNV